MAASLNDKITDIRNAARPNSARVSSTRTAGASSLACDNLAGWPTASKVHFVTYQIDSNSNPVNGTQLDCEGIVSSNTINSFTVIDGSDVGHSVGDVVEMLPTAAWGQDLADALTAQHSRTGAHVGVNNTGGMTNTGGLSTDTLVVNFGSILPAGDIGTADIADSGITAPKLATNAIKLGNNTSTATTVITAGAAAVLVVGVTVTIPAGGRDIEIIGYIPNITDGGAAVGTVSLWDGTVGSGTNLNNCIQKWQGSDQHNAMVYAVVPAPAAGSKTYNMGISCSANNLQINGASTQPHTISVKAI